MNGGSIRIFITHIKSKLTVNKFNLNKILTIEKNLYKSKSEKLMKFPKKILNQKYKLHKIISKLVSENKVIHVYGASTKGNVILQYCNLTNEHIQFAADRNPDKWGRFTPGSNIEIISEVNSRKIFPDYYLVLPWHFRKEFEQREKKYLRRGGSFIFPLPKIEIFNLN